MGSFPADPRAELINHSLNLFAKGQGIVVFPEGNIFQDDNTHHFKTGAAKIAIAAAEAGFDLPIIPLAINYADDGKIAQLVLGTPVSASEYAEGAIASNEAHSKQMRALTDRLYREVCHLRASLGNIADRQALLASPIRRRFAVCTANDAAVNSSMASIPREDRAVVAELDRQAG